MWANSLVNKSGRRFVRKNPVNPVSVLRAFDLATSFRRFSSDDGRGKDGGRDGTNNRGNQAGSPSPTPLARPKRASSSDLDTRLGVNHEPRKDYNQEFFDPAARGELQKHQSSVPKLTGRKPKGHGVRGADAPMPGDEEDENYFEMQDMEKYDIDSQMIGSGAKNNPMDQHAQYDQQTIDDFLRDYEILITTEEEEKYYWKEEDYDFSQNAKFLELSRRLKEEATHDADGNRYLQVDQETFDMVDGLTPEEVAAEEAHLVKPPIDSEKKRDSPMDDPVFQFVGEAMGIPDLDKPPPADYDRVLPLKLSGPTMYDLVESMFYHPSKYGEVILEAPNPERDREPIAEELPNRRNPSIEFVQTYQRFIYVWGLPPRLIRDETLDLDNPLHCMEIQKLVGSNFDVPVEQVRVASATSAFVGFTTIEDHKFAVTVGPMNNTIDSPVIISKFEPSEGFNLAKDHPDALILLENLPMGLTPAIIETTLFPRGTEVGDVYGTFTSDDIVMLSPHSAVIGMQSAELADNAIVSGLVKERLSEFGQHRIRYNKARRELAFTGTHGGPDGTKPLRTLGSILIVDGDMPTKKFFTSHAVTLLLRNLDPSVTKEQIAEYFQPFCAIRRDVEGSTEFVTCREGLPTARAFVGFDELGEAEAALKALSKGGGRLFGLGPTPVIARQVKDRLKKKRREKRPSRSTDELLDSLRNWQQYVDPADLQLLLDHNISIEALDEAFRTIRYNNTTFASLDQAMRSETLNPEKMAGGMYQQLVQEYIATLKECLSTPENPGPIYQSLHYRDEAIDTEIFEREPARQEELRKRREEPK